MLLLVENLFMHRNHKPSFLVGNVSHLKVISKILTPGVCWLRDGHFRRTSLLLYVSTKKPALMSLTWIGFVFHSGPCANSLLINVKK